MAGKHIRAVTLSNGAVVEVREARGRDLIRAASMAPGGGVAVSLALIARVTTTLGGHPVAYEDVQDMPLADVNTLLEAVQGNAPSPPDAS